MESFLVTVTWILLFGVLLGCVVLAQLYWFRNAWRLASRVKHGAWRRLLRAVWVLALLAVVLPVAAWFLGVRRFFPWSGYALVGMWLSSAMLSYLALKSEQGAEWLWQRLRRRRRASNNDAEELPSPSRRYFFQTAACLAGATPFVGALYGFVTERLQYRIERVEAPIPTLPEGLDGLRIVQLSDIHIGGYMPRDQVRRAVEMANSLGADLAVVTGDFVTNRADPLEDCIEELAALRAPLGVWGCNGNHEIYARCEARAASLFRQIGGRILRRENAELVWKGVPFNLLGVDYERSRSALGRAAPMLAGVEPLVRRDRFNLLLSHNPNAFPRAAELGIELTLAGHTHGGQVQVEILDQMLNPARFFTEFVAGLYERPVASGQWLVAEGTRTGDGSSSHSSLATSHSSPISAQLDANPALHKASLYVNRGLGTVGAPVRLNAPPEITLLTLRRA